MPVRRALHRTEGMERKERRERCEFKFVAERRSLQRGRSACAALLAQLNQVPKWWLVFGLNSNNCKLQFPRVLSWEAAQMVLQCCASQRLDWGGGESPDPQLIFELLG